MNRSLIGAPANVARSAVTALSSLRKSSLLAPIGGGLLLLIAACSAVAEPTEAKGITNLAIGEEEQGFRCSATNIAMPADLPDIEACINDEEGGGGPSTGCRGWTKVGPYLTTSDELRSLGNLGAQAYMIEPDAQTLCLYLYRGDRTVSERSFNGVHCYNKTTCDVCWWDAATARGVKPRAQDLRHASPDNCSDCHRNGPLLPKSTLWGSLEETTRRLHQICAAAGGPAWAQAPVAWTYRAPDRSTIVAQPSGCGGGSCHSNGFASGGSYCTLIRHAFADANGSMRAEGKKFGSRTACETWRTAMGCRNEDLDCASEDVARPDPSSSSSSSSGGGEEGASSSSSSSSSGDVPPPDEGGDTPPPPDGE